MPLKASDFGPGECPAIFCDWCGKQITDAANGNYHWGDMRKNANRECFYFSHKSDCAWHVDHKFRTSCCMGLDDFLFFLTHNLNFNQDVIPDSAILYVHGGKKTK